MRIHGIIYILVGGFITGFSYYISTVNKELDIQKFMLFIWVGVVFIIIGLIKTLIWIRSKPKKAKVAKENFPHHQAKAPHQREHSHQHNAQQGQTNQFVKFCSSCGNTLRHFDNFCYKCGNRMFHKK